MQKRSLSVRAIALGAAVIGSAMLLAGCGGGAHSPRLSSLPRVPGARVVADVRQCDQGANPYCELELVLVDPRYQSARSFVLAERDLLKRHGWSGASPQTADELADESPGHKLRITYATAYVDLRGVDLGWIERSATVRRSLAKQLFARSSAMSALLQVGSE